MYCEAQKKILENEESQMKLARKFQGSYDDEIKEKSAIAEEERRKKEAKWIKKTEKSFREVESRAEAILELGE